MKFMFYHEKYSKKKHKINYIKLFTNICKGDILEIEKRDKKCYNKNEVNIVKKYMIIDDDYEGKDETEYEYQIGEQITINSSYPVKCIKIELINNELLQYFITSKRVFIDEYNNLLKLKDNLVQANDNIKELIEEIMSYQQRELKGYCCEFHLNEKCGKCEECKEAYFENVYSKLVDKFIVK